MNCLKSKPLQFSFGVSILFHAAVFGVAAVMGYALRNPALQQEEGVVTLTLVAAPEEAASTPAPPAKEAGTAVVPPVAAVRPEPKNVELPDFFQPAEPAAPSDPPSPAPQTSNVLPPPETARVSAQTIRTEVRGDGSSPTPGLDTTTKEAQPGIDAKPNYLNNPEPPYPLLARRHHQEGLVLLTVEVTAQGHAATVALKRTSGFPLLDEAALRTVRNWEFQPARIGSLAVACQIEVPVRFELKP